jgi:hypothetical protein
MIERTTTLRMPRCTGHDADGVARRRLSISSSARPAAVDRMRDLGLAFDH